MALDTHKAAAFLEQVAPERFAAGTWQDRLRAGWLRSLRRPCPRGTVPALL